MIVRVGGSGEPASQLWISDGGGGIVRRCCKEVRKAGPGQLAGMRVKHWFRPNTVEAGNHSVLQQRLCQAVLMCLKYC